MQKRYLSFVKLFYLSQFLLLQPPYHFLNLVVIIHLVVLQTIADMMFRIIQAMQQFLIALNIFNSLTNTEPIPLDEAIAIATDTKEYAGLPSGIG